MRRAPNRPAGRGADTPPIEWAVAALGAVILFGIVGYLFWHALVRPSGPPEIAVEAVATQVTDGGYLVEFVAVNRGPRTAAAVLIVGELADGDTIVATSQATLDYLPENSEREGGLIFPVDPSLYALGLRAEGYAAP